MTAQLSTSTILAYGPQGAQQSATAVLLSYTPLRTARRVVATFGAPWHQSAALAHEIHAPMQRSDVLDPLVSAPWGQGAPSQQASRSAWVPADAIDRERSATWQQFAKRLHPQATQPWGVAHSQDAQAAAPWGKFAARPSLAAFAAWVHALASDQQATSPWGAFTRCPALLLRPVWAVARRADGERWIPWVRFGRPLHAGWGVVIEDGSPPTDENGTVVVPIRRVYVTVNSLNLVRLDGNMTIPTYSFGMGLDVDSWTWQWSASLHADALPLITPDASGEPVEVVATINGTPYRLCCDGYTRQREFANTRISVKGRGRAALLDAPYAPTINHGNAADRTAQQLMADVLTVNGVGIGWGVEFGLTDWLVPGGVWTHQGPHISAILDIAGAAGGYVQPHNTDAILRILPRYPRAPWHWNTTAPDFELPADVVSVEGTEWQQKAAYNRVYVAGTSAGVLGSVVRAGTAGEVLAPMVTHPLITHADAARQRGIAELSNTGRQARLSLRLPVLQNTGVIKPGAMVRYVDAGTPRLGLVRSTQVEWSAPKLRQVLSVETHV